MRKKIELALLLLLLFGLLRLGEVLKSELMSGMAEEGTPIVLVDAGHGGPDPGKVGINDALEKDINLEVAKLVEKGLKEQGIEVVMTREEDESLAPEGSTNQKIQDMKKRVELINEKKPLLAVSIHQNSYHEESIHGAQVFYYSHSDTGKVAAETMQKALLAVDEENTRQAKANDTYYLLKRTEVPTIIVECGFLSNYEEAEKLISKEYQKALADAIVEGILACLAQESVV